MRGHIGGYLLALVMSFTVGSVAAVASTQRVEVPIYAYTLRDGALRYGVPMTINGQRLIAAMDTGSTGLRVLPGIMGAAPADARPETYGFGSGVEINGAIVAATVQVGSLSGILDLQAIDHVSCKASRPDCPASHVALKDYGLEGDGIPGAGFKAIIGLNMGRAGLDNPLASLGVSRWIVELPRPGEKNDGRLVLNPDPREVSRYIAIPVAPRFEKRGALHDAVRGCISGIALDPVCGFILPDTGSPVIHVMSPDPIIVKPAPGLVGSLVFQDAAGKDRLKETLVFERPEQASHLAIGRWRAPATLIMAGLTPYFAMSVLYDYADGTLGFRPRKPIGNGPNGPVAELE